jgi:ATP-dependent Lhr-like helicase
MISQEILIKCLDVFETKETALLAWGDTGGYFTLEEVKEIASSVAPSVEVEDLVAELLDKAMLLKVALTNGKYAYRSRMGESCHLFRNQRQWMRNQKVDESRTLVSDFRFIRRPRLFPDPNIDVSVQLKEWRGKLPINDIEAAAIESMMGNYSFSGFQVRSTERVIKAWRYHQANRKGPQTGTIVCAGTGSGKTLSFYIPALSQLASDVCQDSSRRVRVLAIYPRKELLKDQFMETWRQCRKLDGLTQGAAGRKIRIAAFFGDTPWDAESAYKKDRLENRGRGLKYDLLKCPDDKCAGEMIWSSDDMSRKVEIVRCTICGNKISDDEVGLTRKAQTDRPPDILFTTTEMLNQHLGNQYQNHLFGVTKNGSTPPTLVLLDEVHTYNRTTGAQTAYLLRRWMQRAFCRPHFVGLSATLADAGNIFAELIGAQPLRVELIEPKHEEMIEKGAEYLLVIRGDPVSQAALLSTTIQSAILARRILDNDRSTISGGIWGSKTFIFTDDLDANNRLYYQLSDAEGWKVTRGGPTPEKSSLAALRGKSNSQTIGRMIALGQDWRSVQNIGHSLAEDDRARIARTSSLDAGVNKNAEVVVATASLEVGYNDHRVGAVIQHKAPRDVASYIQRRGRAGRPKGMRPWMVVILSEFGRDRVAFQRYEELLSPEVRRQGLPIGNSHIQKMQAAMATLDWLSSKLGTGNIWSILSRPQKSVLLCGKLLKLIDEVVKPGSSQDSYFQYLRYALLINDEALKRVLWAPPRSIMLELLPTLQRLLRTDWRELGVQWKALRDSRSPLPEYIPDALFSDLNLPRISVALNRGGDDQLKWEALPFFQALREFAPGRISKRYAIEYDFSDWVVPEDLSIEAGNIVSKDFEVEEAFGPNVPLEGTVVLAGFDDPIDVLRPYEIRTRVLDRSLGFSEKSNSQLLWGITLRTQSHTSKLTPPAGSWSKSLQQIEFCTHQHMCPIELIRFNSGARASLRFRNGERAHADFSWTRNGHPVVIGTKQWVDGMHLQFRVTKAELEAKLSQEHVMRALRSVYFRHAINTLPRFELEPFTAGWVSECFLAGLAGELLETDEIGQGAVQIALDRLNSPEGRNRLGNIPQSLFQLSPNENGDDEQELQKTLRDLLQRTDVIADLNGCAKVLLSDLSVDAQFLAWVRQILGNTAAAATQQALCILFPDIDEQSVISDAYWEQDTLHIWLTESEPGGSGVITRLLGAYYQDAIRVLNVLAHCMSPGDYEQIDSDLLALLQEACSDTPIRAALGTFRAANGYEQRRVAVEHLCRAMQSRGFAITHSLLSVVHSRILRPGSSSTSDEKLLKLLEFWRSLEVKSGIEWQLNLAAHTATLREVGRDAGGGALFERFCKIQGLLWARGHSIRHSELAYYNQFANGVAITERFLGETLFVDDAPSVTKRGQEWLSSVHDAIRLAGRVDLNIDRQELRELAHITAQLQIEPVDHLGLLLYPRVGAFRRTDFGATLRVELAESVQ